MFSRRALTMMIATLPFTAQAASRPAAPASVILPDAVARGSIDAVEHGLRPGAGSGSGRGQGAILQAILEEAAAARLPVFLKPGDYHVAGVDMPDGTQIIGVPGASRLVHTGEGHMLRARNAARISLSGIVISGSASRSDTVLQALVACQAVGELVIDGCTITGSVGNGIQFERCGGRIERNTISANVGYGLYAVDNTSLAIAGNMVADCGDGGILVHRSSKGRDATLIHGNRIRSIAASSGGTGQYGNGINLFRADNVVVSSNVISGCAFSAIRANASSNVLINGNQCISSGETGIYSEFGFEGAIVSANIVDGAANGISVVNFNDGGRLATISGNLVRNLSLVGPYPPEGPGFGIGIAAEADTVISGNTIERAPRWGMLIGWGPYLRNVMVTGNIIRDAATGIAVTIVEGAGPAMMTGNIFDGVPGGAVAGYRHGTKATDDLLSGSTFPHLTISNNSRT